MFTVPESSRLLHGDPRVGRWGSDTSYGNNGAFIMPAIDAGWWLMIIASDQDGWEHVSVHAYKPARTGNVNRLPSWPEMMLIKRTFWGPDDVVMQLAPREADYVNCHPCTLHWWRPINQTIPTPPTYMVGPMIEKEP